MFGDKENFKGGEDADIFEFVSSETTQADTIQDYTSKDQLKVYLTPNDSELTNSNIINGDILLGNVTNDPTGCEVASLDDLKLVYEPI